MRIRMIRGTVTLPTFILGLLSIGLLPMPLPGQNTSPATADAGNTWTGPRTPDGQPDVHGFFVSVVYGLGCLSNPTSGVGCKPQQTDRGDAPRRARAASRIIDTPDGEIPYQPWAKEKQKYLLANFFDPTKQEHIDPQQICMPLGPVRQLTWHDFQILQYPGYVIIEHEGTHVYRVIPLDGQPHIGERMKLWMGDSRGHWEGNTLVVDVTSNNSKGRLSQSGDFADDQLHLVERFKFVNANTIRYEAVFNDPTVYTRPWTYGMDFKRGAFAEENPTGDPNYEQWEEACYEGLHDVDRSFRTGPEKSVEDKK
jgi:hypothetical protein